MESGKITDQDHINFIGGGIADFKELAFNIALITKLQRLVITKNNNNEKYYNYFIPFFNNHRIRSI